MSKMFCFQCEQTAAGKVCSSNMGSCGKEYHTSNLQDQLTGELIALARAAEKNINRPTADTDRVMLEGLFTTITNVSFDNEALVSQIAKTIKAKEELISKCGKCNDSCARNNFYDLQNIWSADVDIRSLKSLILFGLRGMAAYAYHALLLGYTDSEINNFCYEALFALGQDLSTAELLPLVMKTGEVNLKCMALLDQANTESYGNPAPIQVSTNIESGPFIVISGHDLSDLQKLLEQTVNKGINIYTHGEMLPAHAYPKLKAFEHLKGNFGTAWQNQQKEFLHLPAPVLFTTNCIMPVKPAYADRIFTTEVVAYPGMVHIDDEKDFSPVIEKALALGGYPKLHHMTGINGGSTLTTGFGHSAVLANAEKIIAAVKAGEISHFFLVGGCDGAKPGRNYYTEFVQLTPKDSIILTLACGKFRFNDLDLGTVAGLPRLLDMGQCNDAYSAIQVAVALASAFDCTVNELPLTMVLSWYEQKAVCILLSLLHLGIKNIYLGPTLPAFISPNILKYLVENYNLTPISSPAADLQKILS